MTQCSCQSHRCADSKRRSFSPLRLLMQVAFVYAALVFGGGTLINTGHPVAVESGRLMQTVTFVQPTLAWADARHHAPISKGLRILARGISMG